MGAGNLVHQRFLAGALLVFVAGCAASPTPGPTETNALPARAEDVEGPFRLVFELPNTTWSAGEAIEGQATLSVVGAGMAEVSGSGGGLLGFGFLAVGGRRHVEPGWDLSCVLYRLAAGRPILSPITKSGGFSADDPDAAFYRAFLADPLVRLPAGDWQITAVASFVHGRECSGRSYLLTATVLVHVTP